MPRHTPYAGPEKAADSVVLEVFDPPERKQNSPRYLQTNRDKEKNVRVFFMTDKQSRQKMRLLNRLVASQGQ